jgi:L,D-peptidoglycan transpeptidase YkuD (ErfK/YbiS/YcfS/YnhG family)
VEKKKYYLIYRFIYVLPVFLSLAISIAATAVSAFPLEKHLSALERIAPESKQVLLVTDDKFLFFSRIRVYALEKIGAKWQKALPTFRAVIGKKGFAPPDEKREGDGRSPSGIYSLNMTFGYQESMPTKMPYRQALADDLWVDDVNAVDYNRWVKKNYTQAASYEKMKRDDNLYKYGIVIEYNTEPVIKGYGSAIFFHIWRGENIPTAGCVAVAEDDIIQILRWLDPQAKPRIIMGNEVTIERLMQ